MKNQDKLERYEQSRISPADGDEHGCIDCISKSCNLCHETGKYVTDNTPKCRLWEAE
jgi:hypothetical protein